MRRVCAASCALVLRPPRARACVLPCCSSINSSIKSTNTNTWQQRYTPHFGQELIHRCHLRLHAVCGRVEHQQVVHCAAAVLRPLPTVPIPATADAGDIRHNAGERDEGRCAQLDCMMQAHKHTFAAAAAAPPMFAVCVLTPGSLAAGLPVTPAAASIRPLSRQHTPQPQQRRHAADMQRQRDTTETTLTAGTACISIMPLLCCTAAAQLQALWRQTFTCLAAQSFPSQSSTFCASATAC